jgi:hypothetical protein
MTPTTLMTLLIRAIGIQFLAAGLILECLECAFRLRSRPASVLDNIHLGIDIHPAYLGAGIFCLAMGCVLLGVSRALATWFVRDLKDASTSAGNR